MAASNQTRDHQLASAFKADIISGLPKTGDPIPCKWAMAKEMGHPFEVVSSPHRGDIFLMKLQLRIPTETHK